MAKKTAKKTSVKLPRSIKRMFPNVDHAVDATKAVEISVNRQDCKAGKRMDATECALAKAAKRELKVDGVIIGMTSSYLIKGNEAIRFSTPASVRTEIVSFDRHQDFAPGDYRLTPKSATSRFGSGYRAPRKDDRTSKTAKRKVHKTARVRVLPHGVEA